MKRMSKNVLGITLVGVICAIWLVGCGKTEHTQYGANSSQSTSEPTSANKPASSNSGESLSGKVTASGSSALLPLVKQAADEFMNLHQDVTVNVTGGGSGTGVKNVADGTSDIGNSDVAFAPEYKDSGLVDHVVAVAPFALIVNNDVTVDSLTKQQAANIFSGKITNWKDVGGADKKITVVTRPESSGSRKLIVNLVLDGGEFTKDGVTQAESGSLKTTVAETPGAIGYIDIPYVDGSLKALKFNGVAYAPDAISNGQYPLYGVEHMYTKGEAQGAVKAFLDYILSKDFQETRVKELKFLPASFLKH